jgi:hypothetical protein
MRNFTRAAETGRSTRTPVYASLLRLEVCPQRELPSSVPSILCRLRSSELAEGRGSVDLRRRWQEVGVVKNQPREADALQ